MKFRNRLQRRPGSRGPGTGSIALLALALSTTGCTGNGTDLAGDASPTAVPTPAPSSERTSIEQPTVAPTQSPSPTEVQTFTSTDEPAPALDGLVGDDYEQMLRTHWAFRNWLFRHPDPELFDEITHADCRCSVQKDLLAQREADGLWNTGGEVVVRDVEVVDDQASNLVHLLVTYELPEPIRLIDRSGTIHNQIDARGPWLEDNIFIRKDATSPWRLIDFNDRGPVGERNDA